MHPGQDIRVQIICSDVYIFGVETKKLGDEICDGRKFDSGLQAKIWHFGPARNFCLRGYSYQIWKQGREDPWGTLVHFLQNSCGNICGTNDFNKFSKNVKNVGVSGGLPPPDTGLGLEPFSRGFLLSNCWRHR